MRKSKADEDADAPFPRELPQCRNGRRRNQERSREIYKWLGRDRFLMV
jgi:hypothetical protein